MAVYAIAIIPMILMIVDIINKIDDSKKVQPTLMMLLQLEKLFS